MGIGETSAYGDFCLDPLAAANAEQAARAGAEALGASDTETIGVQHPSDEDADFESKTKQQPQPQLVRQPIGEAHSRAPSDAAPAVHLATFVGCRKSSESDSSENNNKNSSSSSNNNNNNSPHDVNNKIRNSVSGQQESDAAALRGSKTAANQRGSLSKQHANPVLRILSASQSQSRINHSLESINSRYSTSSANDDSTTISLQKQRQQQQQSQQHQQQRNQQLQPRLSLRHRLSTSQLSECSPIEAQLASSTCDLGINLADVGLRASFSAGLATTPKREPAKSLVAFISLPGEAGGAKQDLSLGPGDAHLSAEPSQPKPAAQQQQQQQDEAPQPPFMFAGVLASVVGSVFFSLSVLCIKLLPNQEGFNEKVKALCFRGVFVTFLCGVAILVQRGTFIVRRDELFVNMLRAVLGTLGVLGLYCSLSYISMGDATALIFSSPVWTSILSHFILHEPLQWLQLLALPASLFGIVLIAHPGLIVDLEHHQLVPSSAASLNESSPLLGPSAAELNQTGTQSNLTHHLDQLRHVQAPNSDDFEYRWPGIVISLATSLLVSCVYIALKFRKKTPIQTTTFWFGMFMIIGSLALQCFVGPIDIPLTIYEWTLLFGNGVTSWLGQTFLQWAFFYEEAGVLSIVRTLDVAMTFILSALFLDEEILWTSIVGATIIGLVVVSIMLNEWIKKLSCSNRKNSIIDIDSGHHDDEFGTKERSPLPLSGRDGKSSGARSENHHSKQSAYIVASKA